MNARRRSLHECKHVSQSQRCTYIRALQVICSHLGTPTCSPPATIIGILAAVAMLCKGLQCRKRHWYVTIPISLLVLHAQMASLHVLDFRSHMCLKMRLPRSLEARAHAYICRMLCSYISLCCFLSQPDRGVHRGAASQLQSPDRRP